MRPPPHPPRLRLWQGVQRGFTLLELLLVVALAGIILSMVVFSATPNPSRQLEQDALQLAQVFRIAQDEAQVRGKALQCQGDAEGWRFLVRNPQTATGWTPMNDEVFQTHRWSSRLDSLQWASAANPASQPSSPDSATLNLLIGQEALNPAFRLQLRRGGWQVLVSSDGAGAFDVSAPQGLQP